MKIFPHNKKNKTNKNNLIFFSQIEIYLSMRLFFFKLMSSFGTFLLSN